MPASRTADNSVGRHGGADRLLLPSGSRDIEHIASGQDDAQLEILMAAALPLGALNLLPSAVHAGRTSPPSAVGEQTGKRCDWIETVRLLIDTLASRQSVRIFGPRGFDEHSEATSVAVMPPGGGQEVRIPGFGAVFKLGGTDTGGEVAIVELPFAIGTITAPHRHTHEVEHPIVLEGQIGFRSDDSEVVLGPADTSPNHAARCMPCGMSVTSLAELLRSSLQRALKRTFRELGELLAPHMPARTLPEQWPAACTRPPRLLNLQQGTA
jgi:hypothetical protein